MIVWPKECIEWDGKRLPRGYGHARFGGRDRFGVRQKQLAHRHVWEMFNGAIPDGLHVLHRCDNPPCFNLDHLFLGTNADNIADRVAKRRSTWGERSATAKLSSSDVNEIRVAIQYGITHDRIAKLYGVGANAIGKLFRGERWVA